MIDQLAITGLEVQRGGRRLFGGFSLRVREGEAVAITGRNGAGKTTLLRAVAGLVKPEAGKIAFGSADAGDARAGGVHLVGHLDGLKPGRTAAEELGFWAAWEGAEAADLADAVEELQLGSLLTLEVRRLSAGQRRRLALARLLAAPRPLWLLDEPLSPLDTGWRVRFGEIMTRHLDAGGLILAAVHDPLPIPTRAVELPA